MLDLRSLLFLLAVTVLPAAIISWIVVAVVRRFAEPLGLVDRPGERKVHTTPTPLGGGIGIWAGIIGTFLAGSITVWYLIDLPMIANLLPASVLEHVDGLRFRTRELWLVLGAGTVLTLLGLVDDWRGLPATLRLAIEFAVAIASVLVLGYGLTAFIPVPLVTSTLSVIWIVALINSFNMLDNMDGLSGGVAAIIAAMLAAVMLLSPDPDTQQPQFFVAALLLVVVGSLLGFLWHNRPPAKIFMGDAGSYLVGFLIGIATLAATYAGYQGSERPHGVLAPLCVMAVPLYDMTTVLWIRIREGRSPFVADKSHFSHRLVDLGLTKVQAVLTIYLVTGTCGLAALLLGRVDSQAAIIVVGIVLCMLALVVILESTGWRRKNKN
ncbi:glycosyltransferase family 4 protein [Rosistilla oblonga]|uniref:glycosyltransferase family 4 protein n=1 Tax=Rosistilla oblonga TaxID=2527990 RepID=UPI003A96CFB7